jgi:hypothetical protein
MCHEWQSSHKKINMNGNDPTKDLIYGENIWIFYQNCKKKLVKEFPQNNRKLAKIPLSLNVT